MSLNIRVRTQPLASASLRASRDATRPESEVILAMGTWVKDEVQTTDSAAIQLLDSQFLQATLETVADSGLPVIFALPAELPGDGESLNWDFLATSTLVYFFVSFPLFRTSVDVVGEPFHSSNPLLPHQLFHNGAKGIRFPIPDSFWCADSSSLLYRSELAPLLDAFKAAKVQALEDAAKAFHRLQVAPAPGLNPIAGTPPGATSATLTTSNGPPAQPFLAGFLVKDREGRQYPCLHKAESVARITELSAATRFMTQAQFRMFFEHVEIDMEKIERRIVKHGNLAQSASMPDSHDFKSLGLALGLSNLPLRDPKHAAGFKRFVMCDLRGLDHSVLGLWSFCSTPFRAWEHESTVAGREQLRWCLMGLQNAMAAFHDAVFSDVWAAVVEQITHVNRPFRHYTDMFIAVQIWRLLCHPYADAMDEVTSQIDVGTGSPMPIASPADNYALLKATIKSSMADLVAQRGVWAELKPHFDFMDKETGLFKQVVWSGSIGKKRPKAPAAAANPKKPKAPAAAKPAAAGPCLYFLAQQLKVLHGKMKITCGSKAKLGGVCPSGWHTDVLSMTRAQCEDVAKTHPGKMAPVVLAAIVAADPKCFHP